MTIYIAPGCPAEIDAMIRRDAIARGEQVIPARPFPWNRLATDQKTLGERKWRAPSKPAKPQLPCDHGLFGDEKDQLDMCEMYPGTHQRGVKAMTQYFAFSPAVMLGTPSSRTLDDSPRVFQVAGDKHRCRLSLKHPNTFAEVDRKVMDGGMEVIERYRADKRWREITDPARLAEIAAEVGWPAL